MQKMNVPGDAILWNGEDAMLLDIYTPEQQREEWQSDPAAVEGWYRNDEERGTTI